MLCEEEADDLQRRIKEEDRIRERYDEEPLDREDLHCMAMETDRSEVVYEAKLRVAGLEPRQRRRVQHRLSTGNVRLRVRVCALVLHNGRHHTNGCCCRQGSKETDDWKRGDAVVDTGAKKLMIGKEVADMMGLADEDLEPGEAYITAAETLEALCGVTKRPVEFLIGRGTKNCTSAYLKVVVSHSTRYSVLIGTELIAMVGGMVDTWHHKLHYRPDWDIGGHWVVGLPVRMTRELPKNYLACKFYGGLMGTSRGVQEGPDLVRDELVDGNVRLGGAAEGDTELSASVGVVAWVGGVEGNLNLP